MGSGTAGVVGGAGDWPTLTLQEGDEVTFTGATGSSHWFGIKDKATGQQLLGNAAGKNDESGKAFSKKWTVPKGAGAAKYQYYCPPHDGGMNGDITVTTSKGTTKVGGATGRSVPGRWRPNTISPAFAAPTAGPHGRGCAAVKLAGSGTTPMWFLPILAH